VALADAEAAAAAESEGAAAVAVAGGGVVGAADGVSAVAAGAGGGGGGPPRMKTNAPTIAPTATTAPTPMNSGVLLFGGGIDALTTGGAAMGELAIGAPSGNRPVLGRRGDSTGAGLADAAAASAFRSMMPESSRSRAVVARGADGAADGDEPPTLAVSALSEKSMEFSSRIPTGAGAARAAGDAPL
jgi:hypothetical protein